VKPELVFNDLSVCKAASRTSAAEWFSTLMETVADLIDEGICKAELHADRNLYELDLIPDEYGFQEWVDDPATDHDLRILAWHLTTMTPVAKRFYADVQHTDDFVRSEFFCGTERCEALGVALCWDGIAVSLPSSKSWCVPEIAIAQHLYDEDLTTCRCISHRVRHASMPEHVDSVIDNWRHAALEKITSVTELIEHWSLLLPQLDLCVERDRKTLPSLSNRDTLYSVLGRLYSLNRSCERWQRGGTGGPEYDFRARPESKETLARDELKQQRIATCPRRGEAVFEMHGKVQPAGYRMYWFENAVEQRFTIGYIGPHLGTVRHKAQ